jgi:hypothetical protein
MEEQKFDTLRPPKSLSLTEPEMKGLVSGSASSPVLVVFIFMRLLPNPAQAHNKTFIT